MFQENVTTKAVLADKCFLCCIYEIEQSNLLKLHTRDWTRLAMNNQIYLKNKALTFQIFQQSIPILIFLK